MYAQGGKEEVLEGRFGCGGREVDDLWRLAKRVNGDGWVEERRKKGERRIRRSRGKQRVGILDLPGKCRGSSPDKSSIRYVSRDLAVGLDKSEGRKLTVSAPSGNSSGESRVSTHSCRTKENQCMSATTPTDTTSSSMARSCLLLFPSFRSPHMPNVPVQPFQTPP